MKGCKFNNDKSHKPYCCLCDCDYFATNECNGDPNMDFCRECSDDFNINDFPENPNTRYDNARKIFPGIFTY